VNRNRLYSDPDFEFLNPIKQLFKKVFSSMSPKAVSALVVFAICILVGVLIAPFLYENVKLGEYHITQNPITGNITARMNPGPYAQNFAIVHKFPVSETFYFTKDSEGGPGDWSIEVQFNDGATCRMSGTCRVDMPRTEKEAVDLLVKHGFRDWDAIESKLLLPVVRRSLMMSANFMSSKESYADKRVDFLSIVWDQIQNGVYVTKDVVEQVTDPVSGQQVTKITKVAVLDDKGLKIREHNPLERTGITLSNFEIKTFNYSDKVEKQISAQQEAMMQVQTARANALKAQQDAITAEANGKANVMTAKYERETEKVKATVDAEKEKEVAVIAATKFVEVAEKDKQQALISASKLKEVAAIDLDAAKLTKETQIALGQGESERRKLIIMADGALDQKLKTLVSINEQWANAFRDRKVPSIIFGGDGKGQDMDASTFMSVLTAKAVKDLALDMNIPTQTAPVAK
jgi:hypothetical protein